MATDQSGIQIAAALASLAHDKTPLLYEDLPSPKKQQREKRENANYGRDRERKPRRRSADGESRSGKDFSREAETLAEFPSIEMKRYVIMVGFNAGIKPGNVVGAIANEIEIESKYIGHIKIFDDFSSVDLPGKLPKDAIAHLKKVRVCGKPMNLTKAQDFNFEKLKGGNNNKPLARGNSANNDSRNKPAKTNRKPRRSKS